MRDFISRVDRPATGRGQLHVIPVEHARPRQARGDPDGAAERRRQAAFAGGARRRRRSGHRREPARRAQLHAWWWTRPRTRWWCRPIRDTAAVLADVVAELDMHPAPGGRRADGDRELTTSRGVDLAFDFLLPLTDVNEVERSDRVRVRACPPAARRRSSTARRSSRRSPRSSACRRSTRRCSRASRASRCSCRCVINGQVVPVAIPREIGRDHRERPDDLHAPDPAAAPHRHLRRGARDLRRRQRADPHRVDQHRRIRCRRARTSSGRTSAWCCA